MNTPEALGYANTDALYLDWVNNFVTIQGFADYHGIEWNEARGVLEIARRAYTDKYIGVTRHD
jgi:hypothetical protein